MTRVVIYSMLFNCILSCNFESKLKTKVVEVPHALSIDDSSIVLRYSVLQNDTNCLHGYFEKFYRDNKLMKKGMYEFNLKQGKWIEVTNEITSEMTYINGNLNGIASITCNDGVFYRIDEYKDDMLWTAVEAGITNTRLLPAGTLKNGNGDYYRYNCGLEIVSIETYRKGQLINYRKGP